MGWIDQSDQSIESINQINPITFDLTFQRYRLTLVHNMKFALRYAGHIIRHLTPTVHLDVDLEFGLL